MFFAGLPCGCAAGVLRRGFSAREWSRSPACRTVRGPSIPSEREQRDATAPATLVDVWRRSAKSGREKGSGLRYLLFAGRDPVGNGAGADLASEYDPQATWLDGLEPAFGENAFFFEEGLRAMTG